MDTWYRAGEGQRGRDRETDKQTDIGPFFAAWSGHVRGGPTVPTYDKKSLELTQQRTPTAQDEDARQRHKTRTPNEDTRRGHKTRTPNEDTRRGHRTRTREKDTRRGHETRTQDKDTSQGHKQRTPRTPRTHSGPFGHDLHAMDADMHYLSQGTFCFLSAGIWQRFYKFS